jgi:hypothetical protein
MTCTGGGSPPPSGGSRAAESPAALEIQLFASESSALWVGHGATVTLVNSSITSINITGDDYNGAGISANAVSSGNPDAQLQDTILVLEDCVVSVNGESATILANSADEKFFPDYSALVFSNVLNSVVYIRGAGSVQLEGNSQLLEAAPPAASRNGINATSPWLETAQQVCFHCYLVECFSTTEGMLLGHESLGQKVHTPTQIIRADK